MPLLLSLERRLRVLAADLCCVTSGLRCIELELELLHLLLQPVDFVSRLHEIVAQHRLGTK
jgi:hypothetical protein